MKPTTHNRFASLVGAMALGAGAAQAANTLYAPGDLLLYFQQQGGTNTVYVNLGKAATLYRGDYAGTGGDASLTNYNIININASLVSAFGPNWATQTNIYAGLAAARSSSTGTGVIDGDQTRTLYVSRGRDSAGSLGVADSVAWDMTLGQPYTTSSGQIIAMGNPFDTGPDALQAVFPTSTSFIDDYNPFLAPGIQGTAYDGFAGGVQQPGTAGIQGNYSAITGGLFGDAEFALDLYRIMPREETETVGIEVPGPQHIGTYEGSVLIGTDGTVAFMVPEPSSVTLVGVAGLALAFRRRRQA